MTKNDALKKDARAYQRAHPGVRLADAMNAVRRSYGRPESCCGA